MKPSRSIGIFLVTLAIILYITIPPTSALMDCGKERGPVKNVYDPDNRLLFKSGKLKMRKSTIQEMIDFPYPFPNPAGTPHKYYTERVPPYETTGYVIEGTLIEYGLEGDEDYHLVIKDDSGNTLIAEIPNLACVARAPKLIREYIKIAHDNFDRRFSVNGNLQPVRGRFKTANVKVRIAGIGMFDHLHGGGESGEQRGAAPNGIELHPVVGLQFLKQ
jgi:hypothetical protein